MENNKIKKEINDIVNDNLKALEQLFPSAVKDGQLDIKALKEELGDFEEVGIERYELNWTGKQNAKKIVQQGIGNKTLKFVEKDSKNADTTENIYIEGDNLEVLKLLRQNYYNSIKMIYIDPPYNTGNDFVYNDTFKMDKEESDKAEGIISENNEKLQKNQKSTNRYHANWLNMMYPRLKLARDLLTDDGVIFISIDDNEQANLKRLCDEIFGEGNFINQISIKAKASSGASGGGEDKKLKKNIEYLFVYKRSDEFQFFDTIYKSTNLIDYIQERRKEGKNFAYTSVITNYGKEEYFKTILAGNGEKIKINKVLDYEIKTISSIMKEEKITEEEVYEKYFLDIMTLENAQTSIRDRILEACGKKDEYYNCYYKPVSGRNKGIMTKVGFIGKTKRLVSHLSNVAEKVNNKVIKKDKIGTLWDDLSWSNVSAEGEIKYNNGKKPIKLINRILEMYIEDNDIVLDFFSGSSTTAEAVLKYNENKNNNVKYIMIQIKESLIENLKNASSKKSKSDIQAQIDFLNDLKKPLYITEIGKERIRRAGEKIKQEIEDYNSNLKLGEEPKKVPDIGFKVFKVDDTNIKWYDLENFNEDGQYSFDDPDSLDFVLGSNDIDIVYEIMLRQNDIPLSERLEVLTDIGNRTYFYASTYLICLETEITEEMVEKLASLDPLPIKFVFRDSAFKDNISLKDETFRKLRSLIERNSGESKVSYRVEFI